MGKLGKVKLYERRNGNACEEIFAVRDCSGRWVIRKVILEWIAPDTGYSSLKDARRGLNLGPDYVPYELIGKLRRERPRMTGVYAYPRNDGWKVEYKDECEDFIGAGNAYDTVEEARADTEFFHREIGDDYWRVTDDSEADRCDLTDKYGNCMAGSARGRGCKSPEERHAAICEELTSVYSAKNRAYGDSFLNVRRMLGQASVVVRLLDKVFRFKTLVENPDIPDNSESVIDTLKDLANYCIMEIMAIEKDEEILK